MEYSFHIYNKLAADGLAMSADKLLNADLRKKTTNNKPVNDKPPVVVCIGSDLAIGDSLGPIVGSILKQKTVGYPLFLFFEKINCCLQ